MAEHGTAAVHTGETRRDFLYVATAAVSVVGVGAVGWPIVDSMNPTADVLALATTEVDLVPIEVGQAITVVWQSKPVFVRHRTDQEIAAAADVAIEDLRDPQADGDRVQKPEWLILIGICTHLGCIPIGYKGDFNGWFCPCHGSHYDTSGRIRVGPAPENLKVPPYTFTTDTSIVIG
ncbi:MAG: ubiquinol-cytochrome c reductase iron-sulfur subunit [Alphaproteobacteria bacterium]|nr:ubiquinol-cytochrome c reductase iron-sulfur subunit [Alphaproteobacteria bacterium]